jgi:hypothetical protein
MEQKQSERTDSGFILRMTETNGNTFVNIRHGEFIEWLSFSKGALIHVVASVV